VKHAAGAWLQEGRQLLDIARRFDTKWPRSEVRADGEAFCGHIRTCRRRKHCGLGQQRKRGEQHDQYANRAYQQLNDF